MIDIRKSELEGHLSRNLKGFASPKVNLEQYATPPPLIATIIHQAAMMGDISGKTVVDLCAGTGGFAIAAAMTNAKRVFAVEIDEDAITILKQNRDIFEVSLEIIKEDAREWSPNIPIDTTIMNPPFGIQQKKMRDTEFVRKAFEYSNVIYAVVDGVKRNIDHYAKLTKKHGWELTGYFAEEFTLKKTYKFHSRNKKKIPILVVRLEKSPKEN